MKNDILALRKSEKSIKQKMQNNVRITENFLRNLDSIQSFHQTNNTLYLFDHLIDIIFSIVIPNLEQFPGIGVNLLSRKTISLEGSKLKINLNQFSEQGYILKEYIQRDYLFLDASKDSTVYLLSIKHHKQLSYEFNDIM